MNFPLSHNQVFWFNKFFIFTITLEESNQWCCVIINDNDSSMKLRSHIFIATNIGWYNFYCLGVVSNRQGKDIQGIQLNIFGWYADDWNVFYDINENWNR